MTQSMVILSADKCKAACVAVLDDVQKKKAECADTIRQSMGPVTYYTGHWFGRKAYTRPPYGEEVQERLIRDSRYSALSMKEGKSPPRLCPMFCASRRNRDAYAYRLSLD